MVWENIFSSAIIDLTNTTPQVIGQITNDCIVPNIDLYANSWENVTGNVRISIGTNENYDNWLPPTDINDLKGGNFKRLPCDNSKIRFAGDDTVYLKVHMAPTPGVGVDFDVTAIGWGYQI